jgi:hypothetical protein
MQVVTYGQQQQGVVTLGKLSAPIKSSPEWMKHGKNVTIHSFAECLNRQSI